MKKAILIILIQLIVLLAGYHVCWAATETLDLQNAVTDRQGEGWDWKADTKTLTLKGIDWAFDEAANAIILPEEAHLVIADGTKNKIVYSEAYTGTKDVIVAVSDLTVSGTGELIVKNDDFRTYYGNIICVEQGDLEVKDAQIIVNGDIYGSGFCCLEGNISLSDCTCQIQVGDHTAAISTKKELNILGGIYHLSGKNGLTADIIKISNGEIDINASHDGVSSRRFYMNDGQVNISSGWKGIRCLYGDWSIPNVWEKPAQEAMIVIAGGRLSINANTTGISTNGQMTFKDCQLNIKAAEIGISGVPMDEAISITNADVNISGIPAIFLTSIEDCSLAADDVIKIDPNLAASVGMQPIRYKFDLYDGNKLVCENYTYYTLMEPNSPTYYKGQFQTSDVSYDVSVSRGARSIWYDGSGLMGAAEASNSISGFYVDGKYIQPKEDMGIPYIDEAGRTMVPLRCAAEALGAAVEWNEAENSITVRKEGYDSAHFTVNSTASYTFGKRFYYSCIIHDTVMDTTPTIKASRVYIPLRYLAQALDAEVRFDNDTKRIDIISFEKRMQENPESNIAQWYQQIWMLQSISSGFDVAEVTPEWLGFAFHDKPDESLGKFLLEDLKTLKLTDKKDLTDTIEQLVALKMYKDDPTGHWGDRAGMAFSAMQAAALVNCGYNTGLLTRDEVLNYAEQIAELIDDNFTDWAEVIDNYYDSLEAYRASATLYYGVITAQTFDHDWKSWGYLAPAVLDRFDNALFRESVIK